MSELAAIDDAALAQLAAFASSWTGCSPAAIQADAIRQAAGALLGADAQAPAVAQLLLRARHNDPQVVQRLRQAVSVGETYFFRQPDHFRFLHAALSREGVPGDRLTAWSAGCATGEEAHSLAATLLAALPPRVQVEVLGTDLLERNVLAARAGVYGSWSQRRSGPLLFPLLRELPGGRVAVLDQVRAATRFALHNLLDAPPAGPYHLVFCRNVLVYFEPAAAARAVSHLASAVAPGGALVFGTLDLPSPPAGFRREGPAELQIFRRAPLQRVTPTSIAKLHGVKLQATAPPRRSAEEPVALHVRALTLLERGQGAAADALLAELSAGWPSYLPGLLERALLQVRSGRRRLAAALMREVQRGAAELAEAVVDGPEPLPARFYSATARAFLEREAP